MMFVFCAIILCRKTNIAMRAPGVPIPTNAKVMLIACNNQGWKLKHRLTIQTPKIKNKPQGDFFFIASISLP